MKVLHFNTYATGGSAVLMMRLHDGLRRAGVNSQVRFRIGDTPAGEGVRRQEYVTGRVDRLLERARYSFENRLVGTAPASYYSRMKLHKETPVPACDLDCDIIHLHWVGRWLDLPSFMASVPPEVPLVWTVHDMSPLAGGCFLDFGCGEYETGCKRCPLLKEPFAKILASNELNRRSRALEGRRVVIVANSDSTRRLAERSPLFSHTEKHTIYPGVDFATLERLDTAEAKRAFGISPDRLVLGFGAASLTDRNKGIDRFFEVAAAVARVRPGTEVLLFGDGEPYCPHPELTIHRHGKVTTPEQLSRAMSAMDVFVVTSQMETFGQVAIEAQACGTPVWAFAVGGLSETLKPGETGGLLPFGDVKDMAAEILKCANEGVLPAMGASGHDWVRSRFTVQQTSQQYRELYGKLLSPSA